MRLAPALPLLILSSLALAGCNVGEIRVDGGGGQDGSPVDGGAPDGDFAGSDGDPVPADGDGCPSTCDAVGQRRCADDFRFEECEDQVGCLAWSRPRDCAPDQACELGECVCMFTPCGQDCCGDGQVCSNGTCQLAGSCAAVTCPDSEWCLDGACRCQSGWERAGGDCLPVLPADPTTTSRSLAQVCDKWNAESGASAGWLWEAGLEACDEGTLNPAAIDDAVRTLNLYRWLTGLAPVYNQRSLNVYAQPCAIMIQANSALNHSPPDDWDCYTTEGASGAGHSNLAQGAHSPASAIGLYLADGGVPSLGHRRWLLDPPYLTSGIGQAGAWNCTYVMTHGNDLRPAYVAFPAPGPYPRAALLGPWSVGTSAYDRDNLTVTVTNLTTAQVEQPSFYFPDGAYGSLAYLAFSPSGVRAGEDYEVEISGVRLIGSQTYETLTYVVQVVDCN